jgi:hypothetical protein
MLEQRERWGAFSVLDHKNTAALTAEVLLYDRFVVPYPPDDQERQRWREKNWQPELLDERINLLNEGLNGGKPGKEEFVLKVDWTRELRHKFKERMDRFKDVRIDANLVIPTGRQATRHVIANEAEVNLDKNSHTVVVSAYQSENDFNADFDVMPIFQSQIVQQGGDQRYSNLSLMIGHRIRIPDDVDPLTALKRAIKKASTSEFKEKRQAVYEMQESVIKKGISDEHALSELDEAIEKYDKIVEDKKGEFRYEFVVTSVSVGAELVKAGFSGGLDAFAAVSAASGIASIVGLIRSGRKIEIEDGTGEPAAMLHDANNALKGSWLDRRKESMKRIFKRK